jgi:hypothetical protein
MRRALCWVLGLAGLVGLGLFLWPESHGGQGHWMFRMGSPDAWLVWESRPDGGWQYEMNLLRWSIGIFVASVYVLCHSVRLALTPAAPASSKHAEPGPAHDPTRIGDSGSS